MPALRKFNIQPEAIMPASPERAGPRLAGDHAAALSPALALRDQLARRLDEMVPIASARDAAVIAETKLPMAARVAVIVGLSLALWASFAMAVIAVI